MTDAPFVCQICGKESWHPEDAAQGFCNSCHAFTGECTIPLCTRAPIAIAGNVAVCWEHSKAVGF